MNIPRRYVFMAAVVAVCVALLFTRTRTVWRRSFVFFPTHVAVTGAHSALGRHVVDALLLNNFTVTVFVAPDVAQAVPLSRSGGVRPTLRHLEVDVTSQQALESALCPTTSSSLQPMVANIFDTPISGVIHLAGVSVLGERCADEERECRRYLVETSRALANAVACRDSTGGLARGAGKPWVLVGSSWEAAAFDAGTIANTVHATLGALLRDVEQALVDTLPHAVALRFGRIYGSIHHATFGADVTSIGWLLHQAITHQPLPVYSDDENVQMPDLVFVSDAVRAVMAGVSLLQSNKKNGIVDVVGGPTMSRADTVRALLNLTTSASPLQHLPALAPPEQALPRRAGRTSWPLQYEPAVPLDRGLAQYTDLLRHASFAYLEQQLQTQCTPLTDAQIAEWKTGISGCIGLLTTGDPVIDKLVLTVAVQDNSVSVGRPRPGISSSIKIEEVDKEKGLYVLQAVPSNMYITAFFELPGTTYTFLSAKPTEDSLWTMHIDKNSRKFAFGTARLRYEGNPFALLVDRWDGDNAQLTIRGWDMRSFFDYRFTPPMTGSMGREECRNWYHTDISTDGLRAIRNSVPEFLQLTHPNADCNRFQATLNKLRKELAVPPRDRVPRGVYRHNNPDVPASRPALMTAPYEGTARLATRWLLNDKPGCVNDCSYPLVCMDTGGCNCVQANCPLHEQLWAHFKGAPSARVTATEPASWGPSDLVKAVQAVPLDELLLPGARAIMRARQSLWRPIHVASTDTGMDPYLVTPTSDNRCIRVVNERDRDVGSFSADWVLFRVMHDLFPEHQKTRPAVNGTQGARTPLVAVPYYQGCYRNALHFSNEAVTDRLVQVDRNVRSLYPHVSELGEGTLYIMTHDFGACVRSYWFQNCFYSGSRGKDNQPDLMRHAVVVQSMGDWNSACVIPSKDIVIPSRSIMSPQLLPRFVIDYAAATTVVPPMAKRDVFLSFAGKTWGTGAVFRSRLQTMDRVFPLQREHVVLGQLNSDADEEYLNMLGRTQFCPCPAGTTGWSYRFVDSIYAGCIPVLTTNMTLHPFFDMLDYRQFAVFVPESSVFELEQILLKYTLEQKQRMQNRLLRIRSMFVYGSPEPEDELKRVVSPDAASSQPMDISPTDMVLTNLVLRRFTEFPTKRL